jgi:transcriptional regulator with XRE-family HTH domain
VAGSSFGAALRQARARHGLSLSGLSRLVHYSAAYLSRVETGQRAPTAALARRCDEALGEAGALAGLVAARSPARGATWPGPAQLFRDTQALLAAELGLNPGPELQRLHRQILGDNPALTAPAAAGVDPRYLPGDLDGRAALWRDKMAGQRALLVLDNAASSGQVAPLLPGGGECMVLVTSRRHLGDLPGAVTPVLLNALPPEQAADMFTRLAPRAATSPGQVARLADKT